MNTNLLEIAIQAAHRGGEELLRWRGAFTTTEKGPRDLVTEADLASQKAIESFLAEQCPEHDFLGEEDPDLSLLESCETLWVVDPLDGTTNYVHGLNAFAVSIALVRRGVVEVGVIFDPVSGECFSALRGHGAHVCNAGGPQDRLAVSQCCQMEYALIAASLPARVAPNSLEERRFLHVLRECQAVRRIGAAALNLAYLACGRLDAYWATSVQPWDVAAGFLILEEAGGTLSSIEGGSIPLASPKFVASATPELQESLQEILHSSKSG